MDRYKTIMLPERRKRLLIVIVAYNAARTIQHVIARIPASLSPHDCEILIIDDSSQDQTFEKARLSRSEGESFPLTVLYNPAKQGYGGNQKIGFHYAIEKGFDAVALLHGDGKYAPECLAELTAPVFSGEADAVFGSRMMIPRRALKEGMPLYKYAGNKLLTAIQNWILKSSLTEFHSGYRVYAVPALARLPFERLTNDFHFDTEIAIQLIRGNCRIKEVAIPTYYGEEIGHVNGIQYAYRAVKSSLTSRAQDYAVLYTRKFDVVAPTEKNPLYQSKFDFESPHQMAVARVRPGSSVADVGCAGGYVAASLKDKQCKVTGLDQFPADSSALDEFIQCDLDRGEFPIDAGKFDYILLLDIVEHLRAPETLLDGLRESRQSGAKLVVIFSTGNVAFLVTRLGLLLGSFNYGTRGILDITHSRLYTFRTARELFEQAGYKVEEVRGIPAPFPLAIGDNFFSRFLLGVNKFLIRISKSLFSYQIFMVCSPLPSLRWLLAKAQAASKEKIDADLHAVGASSQSREK